MIERLEFLSPQWFIELERCLGRSAPLTATALNGRAFTFQEVFTGVPPDDRSISWHCTFRGGAVDRFAVASADQPDVVVRIPYDVACAIAPLVIGDDPNAIAEFRALGGDRVEREVACEPELAAAVGAVLHGLHDAMATVTRVDSETEPR